MVGGLWSLTRGTWCSRESWASACQQAVLCGRCLLVHGARRCGAAEPLRDPFDPGSDQRWVLPVLSSTLLGARTTWHMLARYGGRALASQGALAQGAACLRAPTTCPQNRGEVRSLSETRILWCLRVFLHEGVGSELPVPTVSGKPQPPGRAAAPDTH